eukprot:scaffold2277_cov256-Pinguiococcus_pyrenoidosus.AAC.19
MAQPSQEWDARGEVLHVLLKAPEGVAVFDASHVHILPKRRSRQFHVCLAVARATPNIPKGLQHLIDNLQPPRTLGDVVTEAEQAGEVRHLVQPPCLSRVRLGRDGQQLQCGLDARGIEGKGMALRFFQVAQHVTPISLEPSLHLDGVAPHQRGQAALYAWNLLLHVVPRGAGFCQCRLKRL